MTSVSKSKLGASPLGREEARELFDNRYFLLGFALQKGTPILILPIVITIVGTRVYADYVLVFSLVQVAAILGGVCVAQTLIPFWYSHSEKGQLVSTLSVVMLALQLLLSIPLGIALWIGLSSGAQVSPTLVPIILIFAVVYNLNAVGLSLVRVQLKQIAFFWSTLFTAGLLTGFIILLRHVQGPKLLQYTCLNTFVLFIQALFYFSCSGIRLEGVFRSKHLKEFTREILGFSVPLTAYTLIALAAMVADKWIVRFFFSRATFAQYVLDFQFAFGVTLVSVAIGMYNTQKQCELVYKGAIASLRRNVYGNYILSMAGSLCAAAAGFGYAHFGGIHLSKGYWLLVLGFTLNNCYGVNSSLLTVQKRSRTIALICGVSTLAFLASLIVCGLRNAIGSVYGAWVGYEFLLLLLSSASIIAVLRHTEEPRQVLVNAESL
jgi:O-antigen/teichoic acid export membrane protein